MTNFNQPLAAPQLQETAQVIAGGGIYTYWTAIAFERCYGEPISHMTLEVAEPGQNIPGWSNQQLAVMQPAIGSLAGQLVITGRIDMRQVVYDKKVHAVQIRIASNTMNAHASTVDPTTDGQGGEFTNQTFLQIAQAVMKKCDVEVKIAGNPKGADTPIPKVNENNGEMRIDFTNRIGALVNLFPVDSPQGSLVYGRPGDAPGGSGVSFVEGQNILAARCIMQANLQVAQINAKGSQRGTDDTNGAAAAEVLATSYNKNYTGPQRPFVLMMEHTANATLAQLRADHEMALINLAQFDVVVTVQGWLAPGGSLWSNFIGQYVSLTSPMIAPVAAVTNLLIKGVKMIQDSQDGTRTEISLCLLQGLGNGGQMINPTPLGVSTPAIPAPTAAP